MRKITLLLMTVLMAIAANATDRQTVVYQNQFQTSHWQNNLMLDKSLFADLKTGDVLWVLAAKDESTINYKDKEEEDAKDHAWYQLSVSIPTSGPWTEIVNSADMANVPYWSTTLTEDQVSSIKANGLAFGGHCVYVKAVAFGSAFATTALQHWDSSSNAWSTEGFTISSDKDTWASQTMNTSGQLKDAKIGDRITVNYTTTATSEWDARVQISDATDNNNWVTLFDFPAGTKRSITFPVTADNYSRITSGDIRIGGCNYSITSINLETTSLYYRLSAYDDNVALANIPTQYAVNIDLYRKYDWNTTLCVPFDLASVNAAFGSTAKAYEFKEYNSGLMFTEREHIEAGKPYLMTFDMTGVEESAKTMTKTFEDMTLNTTLTNSAESGGLTFKGNYTPSMNMEGKYGVACLQIDSEWVWGFYKGASGSKLNAFSAYFEGSIPAARLSIIFDEEVTGINESHKSLSSNDYYTINGMRIDKPTKKGIYILNEKKVIIK
jgi:hypothetical protein